MRRKCSYIIVHTQYGVCSSKVRRHVYINGGKGCWRLDSTVVTAGRRSVGGAFAEDTKRPLQVCRFACRQGQPCDDVFQKRSTFGGPALDLPR